MTWAKFGSEYADEIAMAGLSDAAFRTHTEAIGWVYRVEADDLIVPFAMVRRFAGSDDYQKAITELMAAGFWGTTAAGYLIEHHADVIRQSITAQRLHRDRERERQQRKREQERERRERAKAAAVTPDVGTNITPSVGETQTDRQSRPANHSEQQVRHPNGHRSARVSAASEVQ